MKRLLAITLLTGVVALGAPAASALADPIPDYPGCAVYYSYQPVPVTAECDTYYYNSTKVYDGFSINKG